MTNSEQQTLVICIGYLLVDLMERTPDAERHEEIAELNVELMKISLRLTNA